MSSLGKHGSLGKDHSPCASVSSSVNWEWQYIFLMELTYKSEVTLGTLSQMSILQGCSITQAMPAQRHCVVSGQALQTGFQSVSTLQLPIGSLPHTVCCVTCLAWPQVDLSCGPTQMLRSTLVNIHFFPFLSHPRQTLLSSFPCLSPVVFHSHVS